MIKDNNSIVILIADDDVEDRMMIKDAFEERRLGNELRFVEDGREALREIKNNSDLKSIPIVVLTTSKAQEDIYKTYNLGVNSFITKPVTFEGLVNVARDVSHYWFELVELPSFKKNPI